ncbi:hypothetical protein CEUSTIGMA_g14047.t1, partial [Chlamydomonas eustigma]
DLLMVILESSAEEEADQTLRNWMKEQFRKSKAEAPEGYWDDEWIEGRKVKKCKLQDFISPILAGSSNKELMNPACRSETSGQLGMMSSSSSALQLLAERLAHNPKLLQRLEAENFDEQALLRMTPNTAYEQWEEAEKTMKKEAVYQAACEIAEESSSDDEFGFGDPAIQSMPLPSPAIHLAEAGGGPAAAEVKEISADRQYVGIPTSAPPASNKRGKYPYVYEHRLRNRVIVGSHLKERRILLKILHGDGTGRHPAGRLQEFRHLLKDYDTGLGLLAPEPPVLGQATAVADCQEGLHEQQSVCENPEMFGDGEQSGMVNSFKSSNDVVEVDEDLKELMQRMDVAIMDDQKEAAACAAENYMMQPPSAARKTDNKVSQMKNELQVDHMHAAKVPFHVVLHSAYRRMTQHQRRLAEGGSRRGSSDLDKMEQELGFCEEKDEADLVALQVAIAEATKGGSSEQICTAVAAAAKGYRENVVRHAAMGHSKAPTAVYDASVPPSMRTCSHDTVLCHQPTSHLPHYGTEKNPNHGDSALHLSKSQIR